MTYQREIDTRYCVCYFFCIDVWVSSCTGMRRKKDGEMRAHTILFLLHTHTYIHTGTRRWCAWPAGLAGACINFYLCLLLFFRRFTSSPFQGPCSCSCSYSGFFPPFLAWLWRLLPLAAPGAGAGMGVGASASGGGGGGGGNDPFALPHVSVRYLSCLIFTCIFGKETAF
jgi:hypothetical protein